eukprot:NODE_263_length_12530_cov_0.434881.p6 type:complete len:318 gc:universal NODE_263_length_12530_cov_0.434881:1030-1983(+)
MQISRKSSMESTFACAVDFELTNEVHNIKIAPNSSLSNNCVITHVKPAESCLKYSISWKNAEFKFAKNCDRFGQLKVIPNQRIAVIGRVEMNSKGEWQIGSIPETKSFLKWLHLDILSGILIILRESESACRNRLHGSTSESLPNYTILESLHIPPDYEGRDEEANVDFLPCKVFKLPLNAQQSLIRKLAPFQQTQGWQQEVLFMILVILVVVLAILPIILGGKFSFYWYWPLMGVVVLIWLRIIFRNYVTLIRIEKFRSLLKSMKMYNVSKLNDNIRNLEGQIIYVEGYCRQTRLTLEPPFGDEECLYWWLIAAKK